ncbi:glycosyltransferase [Endozoicomonas montiporae]|uniref:Glycosyltransferase n=2 Tax=Endozoicomonas montiporae TaxID=1027273 RepID=A0A081NCA9_9GAMM|nr:glycosyltransferase family 4 protein [Endozoicomonas montiporae]AMO56413.1 group 1 glycosyl transferase [Endozoicomonas montiporae CL-33]KEQ16082.1 glycosyltransferase [Endozoicomonas montiporae]
MKILLHTQWFDPEPTFKGLLFARALRDAGHEVEVLTGFPNYPSGKVYDGYKISYYKKECIDGIIVHRVPLYPSHDSSSFKRALNYISFCISSFLLGLIKCRNVDVIYSYHPPLTTSLSSVFIGFLKRVPVVLDIQDLWPDTLSATGMINNKKVLKVIGVACKVTYKMSSRIVVLSPGFKSRLISYGVPENKINIIYNWCDEQAVTHFQTCDSKLPDNNKLNLLFAGNMGFAQGLPAIVMAAELLKKKNIPVNIVLLGDGVGKNHAIEMAQEIELDNIYFIPRVPMSEVGSLLSTSDILLVHLNDNDLFKITIPSRTQSNLAIGKPIIMGVAGDAADLVKKSGAGLVCEPNNPESLAAAITTMAEMSPEDRNAMGLAGKKFYYDNLSLDKGVEKFISIFKDIV